MRKEKECCTQPKQEEGEHYNTTQGRTRQDHPANEEFVDQANTEGASASIIL